MLGLKLIHIDKKGPCCGLVSNGFTDSHIVDFRNTINIFYKINNGTRNKIHDISRASCQKGPTRHAYAWQIGPFWQDTLDLLPLQIHHHAYTPDISQTQIMSFLQSFFSVFLPTTKYHLSCFSAHTLDECSIESPFSPKYAKISVCHPSPADICLKHILTSLLR